MESGLSRRAVLAAGAALVSQVPIKARPKLKIAIFSKHLQFVHGEELARAAVEIGFDGIDLTVRKGGHVAPERVRQDLPGLVAIIRRSGLEVPMITTDIVDVETPNAEDILKVMSELEIRNYRWGGFKYSGDRPYAAQLESLKPRIAKLAALNARYQACAMYHTHSGIDLVGASIWDLHILLKDFDPNAVGINYDIGHATIEGGVGGWINSYRISGAHLRGIAVKDFFWTKDAKGWRPLWTPLGEGMVHFPEFFSLVSSSAFSGPVQVHFEYPISEVPADAFTAMKRDLSRLRGYLAKANL